MNVGPRRRRALHIIDCPRAPDRESCFQTNGLGQPCLGAFDVIDVMVQIDV